VVAAVAAAAAGAVVLLERADGRACCPPRSNRAGHVPQANNATTMASKLSAAASSRSNVDRHCEQVNKRSLASYARHSLWQHGQVLDE
jgi:hypothetical protein